MKCSYNCFQEAKFKLKNGKVCCSKNHNSCPSVVAKVSVAKSEKFDHKEAIRLYESGMSLRQVTSAMSLNSMSPLTRLARLGVLKTRSSSESQKLNQQQNPRTLSQVTKDKISLAMTVYLQDNPEKVPYLLNHYSKGASYPERYWKSVLDNNSIVYVEQHRVSLYSLDFAILDKKIDLEIDGEQHYVDDRIARSDIKRTQYLESLGWTILRIRWSHYKKLKSPETESYVCSIVSQLR